MTVENAYTLLFSVSLTVIGVCLIMVILKSVLGPRISDRLMTVNTVGTLVTSAIAILSVMLTGESYLLDICIIYVLISFLSVVVFTTVFINAYMRQKNQNKADKADSAEREKK